MKLRLEFNYLLMSLCYSLSFLLFSLCLSLLKNNWAWVVSWDLIFKVSYKMEFSFLVDPVALLFGGLVLFITGSVILFAKFYMKEEVFYVRFHSIVMLFVVSMLALVFGVSLASLVLGWDGLGVTSYLLVIYYSSWKSSNAGLLTALMNRVGDVFILLSISFFLMEGGYNFNLTALQSSSMAPYLGGLLVLASMTKSAQIPFSAWLPAAMAAPTPVSSLVHSSTLVTAGVYLIIRFQSALSTNTFILSLLLFMGTVTMIMAGISALSEMDMKKIVALSTLSQLGLMMSAIGCNSWAIGYFHMLTHAYVKALLFMSVGNLIHSTLDYQDLRKATLSFGTLPLSSSFLLCTNLSLCGFPFFSTFYSKDTWLEYSYVSEVSLFIYVFFMLAVVITVLYSTRLIFYLLVRSPEAASAALQSEENNDLKASMSVLWSIALISGPGLSWLVFKVPMMLFIPLGVKTLTLKVILASAFSYFIIFSKLLQHSSEAVLWGLSNMWALPFISAPLAIKVFMIHCNNMASYVDKGNITFLGGIGGLYRGKEKSIFTFGEFSNKYSSVLLLIFLTSVLLAV